ncbi:MAG: hypothetical protein U9Q81_20150 [Pseudomonadota bacterium]|nr:hypothetical protein [Pseudomonadota bacterium]
MPDEFSEKPRILALAYENEAYPAFDCLMSRTSAVDAHLDRIKFLPLLDHLVGRALEPCSR